MKKIITSSIFLVLLLFSCEKYTENLNDNPNAFTDSPGESVIGQAALAVVANNESNMSRYSSIFVDQYSGCDRQFVPFESYTVLTNDFSEEWGDVYVSGYAQTLFVKEKAIEDNNTILLGVAQLMEAILVGEATALWGDVPYLQAGNPLDFPNPKYDKQIDVFASVQKLLSESIVNVGNSTVAANYGAPVFVNNSGRWKEIAHSLKARYFLITKEYEKALEEAKLGISSANSDLLAFHSTANGGKNLYYQFIEEQRGNDIGICNNPYLLQLLEGSSPRFIDTPGDKNRLDVYFDLSNSKLNTNDGGYFAVDATFPIVSWVETKLIEAEAAVRTGNDGQEPFNEVRNYLDTIYGGGFPETSAINENLINQILEEKYVSLIGSLQVFHDTRRTQNAIGIPIKGSRPNIPQRFLYPDSESNSNENFPGLIDLFEPTQVNK